MLKNTLMLAGHLQDGGVVPASRFLFENKFGITDGRRRSFGTYRDVPLLSALLRRPDPQSGELDWSLDAPFRRSCGAGRLWPLPSLRSHKVPEAFETCCPAVWVERSANISQQGQMTGRTWVKPALFRFW